MDLSVAFFVQVSLANSLPEIRLKSLPLSTFTMKYRLYNKVVSFSGGMKYYCQKTMNKKTKKQPRLTSQGWDGKQYQYSEQYNIRDYNVNCESLDVMIAPKGNFCKNPIID